MGTAHSDDSFTEFSCKGRSELAQDLEDLSQGKASVSLLAAGVITTSSRARVRDSGSGERFIIEQKPRVYAHMYLHA